MKMFSISKVDFFGFVIVSILLFSQCSPPSGGIEQSNPDAYPVAIIDGELEVQFADLKARLNQSDLLEFGGILDSTTYFDTLQSIVIDSVLSLVWEDVDIRQDLGTYRSFLIRYFRFFTEYIFQNEILTRFNVDSSDVDSFYHANSEKFTYQEQVRAKQLTISTKGLTFGYDSLKYKNMTAEEVDSVAFSIINELKQKSDSGESFEMLAYDHSMHRQSGQNGGDLGYFYRNTYNEKFDSVAFNLDEGEVSEPFETNDGWHLVFVVDHVDSGLAPLEGQMYETAKNQFLQEITGAEARKFLDSVSNSATFVWNDSALSIDNFYTVPDTVWSAIINGRDTADFFRLADLFAQYIPSQGKDKISLETRKQILTSYFSGYLLAHYAEDSGLDEHPDVVKGTREIRKKFALRYLINQYENSGFMPDDSMIEEYYNRNIDKFTFPKPVYVQHIIVEDSVFGEYLRDMALSGIDFIELAKEHYPGEEEIRSSAADLGYIGSGEMPEAFYSQALRTPIGEVSHPVKTEFGYHIIKVVDRKFNRQVSEVRHDIVLALRDENKENSYLQWRYDMLNKYKVEYLLEKIPVIELLPKNVRDNN